MKIEQKTEKKKAATTIMKKERLIMQFKVKELVLNCEIILKKFAWGGSRGMVKI